MKTRAAVAAILALCFLSAPALAGGSSSACATKYPIVLAHGMFASDDILGFIDYWWGIEDAIEDEGGRVYVTKVNAMDTTVNKAVSFKAQVLQILAVTGKAKVNIIGHSHGTIYSRYAITNMGMAGKVASWTSLCGPHRGSALADIIAYGLPSGLQNLSGAVLDWLYTFVMGDTNPASIQNCYDVTRDYMQNVFNPNTPNVSGIYYQSWAAKAKWGCPSVVLNPLWVVLGAFEGDNDGVVSVNSAKWGTFRGVQSAAWYSPGVDHINMVGHLFGVTPGFDAPDFYVDIVSGLKGKGY
ncbi:MAG: alpha/beta hydrolase [Thermodesulfobacteriota bacterium]